MKNPCLTCRIHLSGANKISEPKCKDCEARVAYVAGIGGMTHSVPVPLTTLGGDTGPGDIAGLRITAKEEKEMDENTPGGIIRRICKENGITVEDLKPPVEKSKRTVVTQVRKLAVRELSHRKDITHRQLADLIGSHASRIVQIQKELGIYKPRKKMKKSQSKIGKTIRPVKPVKNVPDVPKPKGPIAADDEQTDILSTLFAGHEKTLERLRKVAEANLRTPEKQLVWIVKSLFDEVVEEAIERKER